MGGASPFLALLCISSFLFMTWFTGKISQKVGVSSIVAEIATGVVLGPRLLGIIYPEYDVCQRSREVNCEPPDNLHELVMNDEPLGEHLGRIAEMEYCPIEDYFNDTEADEDFEGGSGKNSTEVEVAHQAVGSDAHPAAAKQATNSSLSRRSRRRHSHGLGLGRRLSEREGRGWGRRLHGGRYATYEECLVKSCIADVAEECEEKPDTFTLIGHAGVALMIFEGGMHFDFETARRVGAKACIVAFVGTILPQIAGAIMVVAMGRPLMPDGIAAGTAIAPTSIRVSLKLLQELGAMNEDFGQAIITAAFVDDILAMVSFNVLFSLGGAFDPIATVVCPLAGCVFSLFAMFLAVKFWPWVINGMILPRVATMGDPDAKVPIEDEALFLIMIVLMFVYASFTHFLGTYLWGAFMAGVSFACIQPAHHAAHVWERQTKRITTWMIRIFFACTVGFSVPIQSLMSVSALWQGAVMAAGPTILTKVVCAWFMGKPRFVIGWGMVGRGEFAFLIAQMALTANMMDEEVFAVCIWALLWATIITPFVFKPVLNRYLQANGITPASADGGHGGKTVDPYYIGKLHDGEHYNGEHYSGEHYAGEHYAGEHYTGEQYSQGGEQYGTHCAGQDGQCGGDFADVRIDFDHQEHAAAHEAQQAAGPAPRRSGLFGCFRMQEF